MHIYVRCFSAIINYQGMKNHRIFISESEYYAPQMKWREQDLFNKRNQIFYTQISSYAKSVTCFHKALQLNFYWNDASFTKESQTKTCFKIFSVITVLGSR